ncbi:alpha-L-fucosidase [Streptomyces sp. NPDC091377]|uniref:alpha-L-fucosidase n=1 Tax=Streptomyces sp. NPDC091377 TaxID=3365995 RepID=UPI0038169AFC
MSHRPPAPQGPDPAAGDPAIAASEPSTAASGFSRRNFLAATGLTVAAAALPAVGGFAPAAMAADAQSDLARIADLRFGMFNHFNLGTFTEQEWAGPGQSPMIFAPPSVDCGQWADAAAAAKMTFGVLTTKHHDGFSLWPTAFGTQNVMHSGYRQDIVRQYADAFRARGLKVGLYYSVWDRTHKVEAYHPAGTTMAVDPTQAIEVSDMTVVLGQIRELLTNYGTIDIFVTDGWSWEMGQHEVSYQRVRELVKSLQPNCVMVDHSALTEPWVGDAIYFEAPLGVWSPADNTYASFQGEKISNGWFWDSNTPYIVPRSVTKIVRDLRYLEPKYTSYLLNCPPSQQGRLDNNIVTRLAEVGKAWSPDLNRPPLPAQPLRVEWPVSPATVLASSQDSGFRPYSVIDARNSINLEYRWATHAPLPQSVTIDLGGVWSNISALEYLPRQLYLDGTTAPNGAITAATISTSTDGLNFTPVATVSWAANKKMKFVEWPARSAGYVRVTVTAAAGGYADVSGLHVGGRTAKPALVSQGYFANPRPHGITVSSTNLAVASAAGSADGTPVVQQPWTRDHHQRWTIEPTGDGFYRLRNNFTTKLLQVDVRSRDAGATVDVRTDAGKYHQHWALTQISTEHYVITNRHSQLALTVPNGSTTEGVTLEQRQYDDLPNQKWRIFRI